MGNLTLGTKKHLTLDAARKIAEAAEAEAIKQGLRMSIAVVDDGGYLLSFLRMDGVAPAAGEVALAKAKSAALFGRSTKSWEEAAKDRTVVLKIPNVMPLGGGVPLLFEGQRLGAIGVSGSTSVKDDEVAQAGAVLLA